MKRVSAADLDKFLAEKGAAPSIIPGAPAGANPLQQVNGVINSGSNTLQQINELAGNINKIIENFQGMIMKGAERKEARQMENYDDYVRRLQAEQHDKESKAKGYGQEVKDESKKDAPGATPGSQDQAAPPGAQAPPQDPPGDRADPAPAAEMPDAAGRVYAWFGHTLTAMHEQNANYTLKEILEEWRKGEGELTDTLRKIIEAKS